MDQGNQKKLLDSFGNFFKYTKVNLSKPRVDDLVFKLHYRGTTILLLFSVVLVSQRQYIGEHIKCINDKGVPSRVVNTFCFFSYTFTSVNHFNETGLELEYIPHPGVGTVIDEKEVVRHAYYQWVPFVLFLQALAFYAPHFIWRKLEGGRLAILVFGLRTVFQPQTDEKKIKGIVVFTEKNLQKKIDLLKEQFLTRLHGAHAEWARNLILCETLNFVNLVIQVYLTDAFLGGAFMDLGPKLARPDDWSIHRDPLDFVFPKVTKCTFHKYGPTGTIQNLDALCVMALNIIHEKIFVLLWFWYTVVFAFTCFGLVYRAAMFALHSRSAKFNECAFAYACPVRLDAQDLQIVTDKCYFGDWLFLYFLAKNMSPFTFKKLFESLAEKMEAKSAAEEIAYDKLATAPEEEEDDRA